MAGLCSYVVPEELVASHKKMVVVNEVCLLGTEDVIFVVVEKLLKFRFLVFYAFCIPMSTIRGIFWTLFCWPVTLLCFPLAPRSVESPVAEVDPVEAWGPALLPPGCIPKE